MNLKKTVDHGRDMLTPREVAERTGMGVNAVYYLLQQKKIPHFCLGRTILIPRPQYERWLETVKGSFDGPTTRITVRKRKPITPEHRAALLENVRKARQAWKKKKPDQNDGQVDFSDSREATE